MTQLNINNTLGQVFKNPFIMVDILKDWLKIYDFNIKRGSWKTENIKGLFFKIKKEDGYWIIDNYGMITKNQKENFDLPTGPFNNNSNYFFRFDTFNYEELKTQIIEQAKNFNIWSKLDNLKLDFE